MCVCLCYVMLQFVDKKRLEKADAKLKLKQDKRALQEKNVSENKGSDTYSCTVHVHKQMCICNTVHT